jgi:tRNA pseudouridine55 synthase
VTLTVCSSTGQDTRPASVSTRPCGVIFLDKPLAWTSRRAVNEVIRLFTPPGEKRIKAGHCGTLDPLATGMLPVLIGEATRFAELGLHADKQYRVSIDLSFQTNTLDCEGETSERFDAIVSRADVQKAVADFIGEQRQTAPAYSAIRLHGKRAHEMARKGEMPEMPQRLITVFDIQLLDFVFPLVTLEVRCSKGTYIRSLARDIGARLGMGGCVTALRRLSTGGWPEAMMVSFASLSGNRRQCLLPLDQWLRDFPRLDIPDDEARRFVQGQRIQLQNPQLQADKGGRRVAVFAARGLLGTGDLKPGLLRTVLHPARILPSAQEMFI